MTAVCEQEFKTLLYNQIRLCGQTLSELETRAEPKPEDANKLFRFMHNIKSTSSYIGYLHISKEVHKMEDKYIQAISDKNVFTKWKELLFGTKMVMEYIDCELEKIKTGEISAELDEADAARPLTFLAVEKQISVLAESLAKKQGKKITLCTEGFGTEVEGRLFGVVTEGILQFVTNACDHGIEPERDRLEKGKPAKGKVTVVIKRLPGELLVIVDDNGRGINRRAVYQDAAGRGFTDRPFEEYTDSEIYQLLFQFGVTTKKEPTLLSGRGFGIAAVYKGVAEQGGFLVIDSKEGFGSTFIIKLPL